MLRGRGAGNVTRAPGACQACLDKEFPGTSMILKIIFIVSAGAMIIAAIARARMRAQWRRAAQMSELNQHPERLEQMLDETDDA